VANQAKVYLDEDMSEILAGQLQKAGWDVLCVSKADRRGVADGEQLAFATRAGRVLITRNIEDFLDLHETCLRERTAHAGIIICFWRANPQVTYNKVLSVLKRVPPNEWTDRLEYA